MAANYDIVTQAPTTVIGPDGRVVRAIEVRIATKPSGVPVRVDVMPHEYTPETLGPLLAAAAENAETIQNL